jgi:hypothetical protein
MKFTKGKYIILMVIALLVLTDPQIRTAPANPGPRIYLDPSSNIFYSNVTSVGYRFNLTVWCENVPDLGGAQIYLEFNDSIINVTRWFVPSGDPYFFMPEPPPATALPTPPDPGYIHVAPGKGYVKVSVSKGGLPPGPPWGHSGKIAIFEFVITAMPPEDGQLTCPLHINTTDTFLLDPNAEKVSNVIKEDGTYTFIWAGAPPPYLAVDPISVEFGPYTSAVGQIFNATVYVMDVASIHSLSNVTFSLTYNQTLISTEESNVTIADLWQESNIIISEGKVNITVANPSATPAGTVEVAKIRFTVLYQGESPPLPLGSFETSELTFIGYKMLGVSELETAPAKNGRLTIYALRTLPAELQISEPKILDSEIQPKTKFIVNFTVNDVVILQKVYLKIIFNPNIINITNPEKDVDFANGTIFEPFPGIDISYTVNNTAGYIILSGTLPSSFTFTGSGLIVRITFTGVSVGISYLNFSKSETKLLDATNDEIDLTIINRNIQVVPEFSIWLILPLFACLTLIAATFRKKRITEPKD